LSDVSTRSPPVAARIASAAQDKALRIDRDAVRVAGHFVPGFPTIDDVAAPLKRSPRLRCSADLPTPLTRPGLSGIFLDLPQGIFEAARRQNRTPVFAKEPGGRRDPIPGRRCRCGTGPVKPRFLALPEHIEVPEWNPIYFRKGVLAVRTVQAALIAAALAAPLVLSPLPASTGENSSLALTISIDGAIGPAAASYVKDALTKAAERHAEIVVLRLNTPGGLTTSMREIIADLLASPVPVVGYVAPSGAHAASAGTYILYATHIAAMAPGTNLGAATPVQIGGPLPGLPSGTPDKEGKDKKDSEPKDAMTAKTTNDAVAFIRSLAELHGRNADWAEKAVREAASLSANGALQEHVIDLVARDPAELLRQVDGRAVEVAAGGTRHLATKDAVLEAIDPGWTSRFLAVITDPNVAFILLMVGIYGLIFEFMSPGAVAPGVVGTICLLLGLYALNLLPINYAGLALMLVGIALLAIEAFNPTVVLGLGGIIAFVLGAVMLFKVEAPGYRLSWPLIGIVAAMFIGLVLVVLNSLRRARKGPVRVGAEAMRGLSAEVLDWSESEGHVFTQGERWQARGAETFEPGEVVEVANIKDLTLLVRRRPALTNQGGTS
jgi:membrane-bound serine protease (ClpP class)